MVAELDPIRVANLLAELRPLLDEVRADSPMSLGKAAEVTWRARRARDAAFDQYDLFGEPSWDIILDIARNEARGEAIATSSVALGSGVPATTVLRHIAALVEAGLIERRPDVIDKRRTFLRLTREGKRKLTLYAERAGVLRNP